VICSNAHTAMQIPGGWIAMRNGPKRTWMLFPGAICVCRLVF
jgi:hypothetical protein